MIGYMKLFPWKHKLSDDLPIQKENSEMAKGKRKTADFKSDSIDTLAKDKSVVYKILNRKGENIYTGKASRGRVHERIKEHLPGGADPIPGGSKVRIEQKGSIQDALETEKMIISRSKPKYNKRGK
jgi:excinuclease UvrABC nuclease subunit